ncbi:MAG: outer membrane protein assembly factor [Bacteroides sp.]|nr:outer membrane protein assembly factor [Bacteroides sp.]
MKIYKANYKTVASLLALILLLVSCSTTRNLPEGEVLYTGQKKKIVIHEDNSEHGKETSAEVNAALHKAPNNSLFGSDRIRFPIPFGLWMYNALVKYENKKGFGYWLFERLAATPVYISTVNPELRTKVATNLLHDYGYFNGTVAWDTIPAGDRKAKVQYTIDFNYPYFLDSITIKGFPDPMMRLFERSQRGTLLHRGEHFNVVTIDSERSRMSALLRNRGYYYFRPDYISVLADTTQVQYHVPLVLTPRSGIPDAALKPWYIGKTTVLMNNVYGNPPNDSLVYNDLVIHYRDKLGLRPKIIYKMFQLHPGDLYTQRRHTRTQERFNQLGIFRYTEMQFTPQDSTMRGDSLNMQIMTSYDLPIYSEFEANVTSKSNDYIGPGAVFTVTRKNLLRSAETFTVNLRGSYEWQTNSSVDGNSSRTNSYELGINTVLSFPRLLFPLINDKEYDYPATTSFRLYGDLLNRPRFFRMYSFGGDIQYDIQTTRVSKHTVVPFRLTFNLFTKTTDEFNQIIEDNPALEQSFTSQFIPAMSYTYTYDNGQLRRKRNHLWWQSSITSAGNITSGIYAIFGQSFKKKEKQFLGNPFAQFIKLTSEIRYTIPITPKQSIATRLMGGVIFPYGNMSRAPYSEQFYIGGANSIRAFTIRTIGPGSFDPALTDSVTTYSYLKQTGEFKLEGNVEYRFKIVGNLEGAVFLDAGNVWLIKKDPGRPGGKLAKGNFWDEIALGTGAGLRYDLDFLVVRFDCGVGIHAPYDTGKSGYYNMPKFKNSLGWHLAVGYPF